MCWNWAFGSGATRDCEKTQEGLLSALVLISLTSIVALLLVWCFKSGSKDRRRRRSYLNLHWCGLHLCVLDMSLDCCIRSR